MNTRLFFVIAGMQARKLMSYRVDFWISTLGVFAASFGVIFFIWEAIFRDSGQTIIQGMSFKAILLYYVITILITKLVWGGDGESAGMSSDIYEGGLSRYIVYPTSYFPFKYAERVGALVPALVQMGMVGAAVFLLIDVPPEVDLNARGVAMGLISVLLGSLLNFAVLAPIEGVAFWADNVWSLTVIVRFGASILGGSMLPLALYPEWAQEVLFWLPFAHIYHVPANAFLGRIDLATWLMSLGIGFAWMLALSLLSRVVWRAGMRIYTGVGM